jgi:hypothetical protein
MQILRSAASKQSVSGLIKGKGSKAEMLLENFCLLMERYTSWLNGKETVGEGTDHGKQRDGSWDTNYQKWI